MIPQVCPWLGAEEAGAASQVVFDGWVTEGPKTKDLTRELNKLIGVPFGVFAPNGTLALALGLMALDLPAGSEILIPDTTFIASATAAVMVGLKPVFVDVDLMNFQIDLADAAKRVTINTSAIMPVHLYGAACDMLKVNQFAQKNNLKVIEDACQGIGVWNRGNHVGSTGDVGCFSFFADKTITMGEGGYVTCTDPGIFERLQLLRNQGRINRGSFIHPAVGYNFRITDIQAAVGLVQMKKLPEIIRRKKATLDFYKEFFGEIEQVTVLGPGPESNHIPFRCVILAESAHELMEHLRRNGVEPRSFFYPLHRQPCFLEHADLDYPNADQGYAQGVCLPIFPTMTPEDMVKVCRTVEQFYK